MSKTKAATVAAERLKSIIDRVERLNEERAAIQGDIRDVFIEAKSAGYDVAALRWLIKERTIDVADRDERDQLRDTYAMSLGMAVNLVEVEGLSLREASRKSGVSKSSIHRALAVPDVSQESVPPVEMVSEPEEWSLSGAIAELQAIKASLPRVSEPETGSATRSGDGLCDALSPLAGSSLKDDAYSTEEEITKSCGLCPVPPGSVAPDHDGNGFRMKGEAEPLAATSRRHSLASCDGVLPNDRPASQCEDSASPGPQEPIHEPRSPALVTPDSVPEQSAEPVEPPRKDGWAGGRGPDDGLEIPAFLRRARA